MIRKIITTSDGSKTIQIEDWNEQYHSIHGAIQEANHVFLKHGLLFFCSEFINASSDNVSHSQNKTKFQTNPVQDLDDNPVINILEIGFGTGLNAFLTFVEAERLNRNINYVGVEAYPVEAQEIKQLNYIELISKERASIFEKMHKIAWQKKHQITSNFQLEKQQKFFQDITAKDDFNIIYFDAFGARVQPDLWTEDIFSIMYNALKFNGILVTYSAKGSVRRAMQAVGFKVERLPGPPGKREMLRGTKHLAT